MGKEIEQGFILCIGIINMKNYIYYIYIYIKYKNARPTALSYFELAPIIARHCVL